MHPIYSIPLFVTTALTLLSGFYVLFKNPWIKLHRIFALAAFSTAIWTFFYGLVYMTTDPERALLFVRLSYFGVVLIPTTYCHFAFEFLHLQHRRHIYATYLLSGLFLAMTPFRFFIDSLYVYFWGYYPKVGSLYIFFVFFFYSCFGSCLYFLCRYYISLKKNQATSPLLLNQVKYVLLAFAVASASFSDFLPKYHIEVYPFAYLAATGWVLILAYATFKYQVMDINVIIRKTLIYSMVTSLLTVLYLCVAFLMAHLLERWMGARNSFSYGVAACMVTLLFHPLRNRIQRFVDQRFFRDSINREATLLELSNAIVSRKDPAQLTAALMHVVREALHPVWMTLYLRSAQGKDFQRMAPAPEGLEPSLPEENLWATYFHHYKQPLLPDLLVSYTGNPHEKLLETVATEMKRLQMVAAFPLISQGEVLGYLLFGGKKSDEHYTPEDLSLIRNAINQTTVAYERYLLDQGLQEAPKTLETMASSFVHEIKTPMANIKLPADFLEMCVRDLESGKRSLNDVLPTLKKQLGYIQEQSKAAVDKIEAIRQMSKNQKDNFARLSPVELIRQSISTLDQLIRRSNVQLTLALPEQLASIYGNQQQLGIVFMNLVKNGIEAMMNDASGDRPKTLRVEGHEEGDSVVVMVADSGPGIQPEHIHRLFNAYFSTKGSEGTGMGLFLAQEVIKAHGGTIDVKSEYGSGTTFIVRLPVHRGPTDQAKNAA